MNGISWIFWFTGPRCQVFLRLMICVHRGLKGFCIIRARGVIEDPIYSPCPLFHAFLFPLTFPNDKGFPMLTGIALMTEYHHTSVFSCHHVVTTASSTPCAGPAADARCMLLLQLAPLHGPLSAIFVESVGPRHQVGKVFNDAVQTDKLLLPAH